MPQQDASKLVHHITNRLTEVLGYFELGEYAKAAKAIHAAIKLLGQLRHRVSSLERGKPNNKSAA